MSPPSPSPSPDRSMEDILRVEDAQSEHLPNPTGEQRGIEEQKNEAIVENDQAKQLQNELGEQRGIEEQKNEALVENDQAKQLPNELVEEENNEEKVEPLLLLPNQLVRNGEGEIEEVKSEEQIENVPSQFPPNLLKGEAGEIIEVQEEQLSNPIAEELKMETLRFGKDDATFMNSAEGFFSIPILEDGSSSALNGNSVRPGWFQKLVIARRSQKPLKRTRPLVKESDHDKYNILKLRAFVERNKGILKWIPIAMNVSLEVCKAVISQEAGDDKIRGIIYRRLSLIFSAACLALSLLELFNEGMRSGVKLQKIRGGLCCLYNNGRVFGEFRVWFGVVSSLVQVIVNTASLEMKRDVLKFDCLGLLLSLCYLYAALLGEKEPMATKVRCSVHGDQEPDDMLLERDGVYYCIECSSKEE